MKRLLPILLFALLTGCSDVPESERVVVKIGDEGWSVSQLTRYFQLNLPAEGDSDDRVKSRLLDRWIDERLVLQEAGARELVIADQDLDDMIEDPEYEGGDWQRADQRRHLRERLLIELLQSLVLADHPAATVEELQENLSAEAVVGRREARIRALRFDDGESAMKVHQLLRKNRLTFNEAVVQYASEGDPDGATSVDVESLPPEVREAIEPLKSGWSSSPVEMAGNHFLFQLVEWVEGDAQQQLERLRDEYETERRRAEWGRFVAELRQKGRPRIRKKNLPFRYVAENSIDGIE
jgi:hypothetical protein